MIAKWVVASTAAAAVLAGGVAFWDPTIHSGMLWLAGLEQPQAENSSPSHVTGMRLAKDAKSDHAAMNDVPRRTETITYGAWVVTCSDTVAKGSKKVCTGALKVIEEKQRRVLFAWIVGRDSKGVLRTVMQTPTGVLIQKGVELKLGKEHAIKIDYTACMPQQCQASIVMNQAMVKQAAASSEAVATIYAANGRAINFKMSINGIDKMLASIGR